MPRFIHGVNNLAIRFAQYGCANRPFYQLVVMPLKKARNARPIEQIGSYDPMPNDYNEKLLAVNFERLKYWLVSGAIPTKPVSQLLGLAGFFPVSPVSYLKALRNRKAEQTKQDDVPEESTSS